MCIYLDEAGTPLKAGSTVQGKVMLSVGEVFEAENITLTFRGIQRTSGIPDAAQGKVDAAVQKQNSPICEYKYVLASFGEKEAQLKGDYEFPFEFTLPDWLPSSAFLKEGNNEACVSYLMVSQVTPVSASQLAEVQTKLSMLRTERGVYIRNKNEVKAPEEYTADEKNIMTQEVKAVIGKTLGVGGSEATATITLESLQVRPGEAVKVKLNMDNSTCGKAVKSYKFKLNRIYRFFTSEIDTTPFVDKKEYVMQINQDGCGPKTTEDRDFAIKIDAEDESEKIGDITRVPPILRPLVKGLTPTITTKLFSVAYSLDVFVKHDAWNEFG